MNQKITGCLNFFKKNPLKLAIVSGILLVIIVTIALAASWGTNRRTFIFPLSGSTKNQKEVRRLDSNPVQGKIQYYVDELILGPSFYRGRNLFTPGTSVEFCFVRDKKLIVGLSEDAVLQEGGAVEFTRGLELFKKNIKKNFTDIKEIEIFVNGNCVTD